MGWLVMARAIASKSEKTGKDLEQVIFIPTSRQALTLDTCLHGFLLLDQIERNMPQHCKILRSMVFADPALIFTEGDIKGPMQDRPGHAGGGRSQDMAYRVVHELKGRLRSGCIPVFSTDGLKHYFYALTAHFGLWESLTGKKPIWVLFSNFVYAQVIKHQRRRRTVQVERRILCGEEQYYRERLKSVGLSGRINTSFVERINLTIRQCVSKLTRRTWGPAHFTPELLEHLEWWRAYYHFVRFHESLAVALVNPKQRKGEQQPIRYRHRTPAMAANLTNRRWTVKELLSYPLP